MCLISDGERILLGKGHDKIKNEDFYRVLGGTLEFGETCEVAVRREIKEELGCEIENLKRLDVIENIFTYEGKPGHEITFMFSGEASDKSLNEKNPVHIVEPNYEFDAFWVPIEDIINKKVIVYPSCDYKKFLK